MRKLSWIEKLNRSLELSVDDATRAAIMEGSESLTSASGPQKKATWVGNAMERMDSMLDEKTRIEVMERCSCDFEARKRVARRIYEESTDIDDFIKRLGMRCNKLERVGNILYSIKTEGCDCGWVRATKTPISPTFCHCGKGYIARYFEAVFQKPVRVDVIQAAVWGDEVCRFAIYLDDEILNASGG